MKFVLYKDNQKQYRWTLRANNGRIIADSSEGYTSKQACQHGIDIMKRDVPKADVSDETEEQ
ncbi:MAG: DUF1508 domain-containing protein [Proteobacteria bacterium]|nr:MAG: DUF1508 domain-containing protein [Pseudomonadota bacterium]